MTQSEKISLFLLRVALGFLFFYAGVSKLANPKWTSAGYLKGAKVLTNVYAWFGSASNIGWVNFLNEWGLTLVGVAIILGVAVRFSSICGMLLMALYYVPILNFPMVGQNSYIVDEHIIFILVFALFIVFKAGEAYGLGGVLRKTALGKVKLIDWLLA